MPTNSTLFLHALRELPSSKLSTPLYTVGMDWRPDYFPHRLELARITGTYTEHWRYLTKKRADIVCGHCKEVGAKLVLAVSLPSSWYKLGLGDLEERYEERWLQVESWTSEIETAAVILDVEPRGDEYRYQAGKYNGMAASLNQLVTHYAARHGAETVYRYNHLAYGRIPHHQYGGWKVSDHTQPYEHNHWSASLYHATQPAEERERMERAADHARGYGINQGVVWICCGAEYPHWGLEGKSPTLTGTTLEHTGYDPAIDYRRARELYGDGFNHYREGRANHNDRYQGNRDLAAGVLWPNPLDARLDKYWRNPVAFLEGATA